MSSRKTSFVFLFILLLTCSFSLFSQKTKKEISPSDNRVGEKITSLVESSRKQFNTNLNASYAAASEAYTLSGSENLFSYRIESSSLMAGIEARTNKCRQGIERLQKELPLTQVSKDSLSMARIYSGLGLCYYYIGLADSSKVYHEKAVLIYKSKNHKSLLFPELNHLSRACLLGGETNNASNYNTQARTGFEELNDKINELLARDTWAEIMQVQRLYDKALERHSENFQQFSALNNTYGKALAALHMGSSYYMQAEDDSSQKYYQIALALFTKMADINGMAFSYSNLSRVLLEKGEIKASIENARMALTLIKGGDYKRTETATLQHLGDIYAELGQYPLAISYMESALALAQEIGHKSLMMDSYKSLSEINETIRKPAEAYAYLLKAYRLKDELQPLAFSKKLAEMQDQFEEEKQKSEIHYLMQQDQIKTFELNEQSNKLRRRNIILFFTLAILMLSALLFYFINQKRQLKTALEKEIIVFSTQEKERHRFAKDLHDDMGSELSKINFLSELISKNEYEIPEIKKNASAISEATRNLVENMRDLIWALNPENSTLANLVSRIREYASDYLEDFPAELKFNFPDHVNNAEITHEGQREILMTIKESLNNIVKHSGADSVELYAAVNETSFEIAILDNGKGMEELNGRKGNGLRNMQQRIESLGGSFTLDSLPGSGTKIQLSVPICILLKNRIPHM